MKIVKFKGGMGNQMFQYAFLRHLELCYGLKDVKADFSYFSQCEADKIRIPRIMRFKTMCSSASEEELKNLLHWIPNGKVLGLKYRLMVGGHAKINSKYYYENNRAYRDLSRLLDYDYFDGYWQSWRYLEPIRKQLLEEFKPKSTLSDKTLNVIKDIKKQNSVFVGVRRGDYLADKHSLKHFGDCDLEYYKNAINLVRERVENPTFIFFSNDIEWVKDKLNELTLHCEGVKIVYRNDDDVVDDFEELFVMASCDHAIISNSTFNFWGAWLIDNPKKIVVAPEKWFKDNKPIDIVPNDWIKL